MRRTLEGESPLNQELAMDCSKGWRGRGVKRVVGEDLE